MTKFELLLLKIGSPELVDAYFKEYKGSVGDDFRKAVVEYGEKVNKMFSETRPVSDEILNLKIRTFLNYYCEGHVVRIFNTMRYHGIETVGDLVKLRKGTLAQTRNFGRKSMASLCNALAQFGLKLED